MLTSSDLGDLAGCWEKSLIEEEEAELSAKLVNAHRALDYIEQLMSRKGTILDLGCFCGTFLHAATQRGWASYGIEPLVGPAIYARAKFGLNVITDTLRDDTFPLEFFDVVTAFQVFEHLPDPLWELARIWRILKPGGLLVVEVPNIDTVWVRLLGKRHRHFVTDHLYFFSPQTLDALLERAGFTVLKVQAWPRTLSLRKVAWWIERARVVPLSNVIATVVRWLDFQDGMITVDLGDIICAFARKTAVREGMPSISGERAALGGREV
jgi:SAM-dependent methyltransferase